jgi:hypothetical protein
MLSNSKIFFSGLLFLANLSNPALVAQRHMLPRFRTIQIDSQILVSPLLTGEKKIDDPKFSF